MRKQLLALVVAVLVLVGALTGLAILGTQVVTNAEVLAGGNGKTDPIYGRCHTILVATWCTGIPLAAVAKYGGVSFPRGSTVVASSSSGENFYGGGSITATIRVPQGVNATTTAAGTVSPNNRITYDPRDNTLMTVTAFIPDNG